MTQALDTMTVIAGGFMYWHDSDGFNTAFVKSRPGIGFTIGAIAAIIAWLDGSVLIGPTAVKFGRLGDEIAASGAPPTPEQASTMAASRRRLRLSGPGRHRAADDCRLGHGRRTLPVDTGREMDFECSCGRRWRLEHYFGKDGELFGPSWVLL